MNLINNRINELIDALASPRDETERQHNAQILRNFIRAYGTSQRVQAVKEQDRLLDALGYAVVKKEELEALNKRMSEIASYNSGALSDADTEFLETGLKPTDEWKPRQIDDELEGPEFVIDDPDLDRLLNDTATLLGGYANMDVGISWSESLDRILNRLKQDPLKEEADLVGLYQTRYRIHVTMDKTLGRTALGKFKAEGLTLKQALDLTQGESTSIFLSALRTEFGIDFSVHASSMYEMNSDALAAFVNAIPNKKGLGQ
jgi:hypothetical protein